MATSSSPAYRILVANFSQPYPSLIRGSDTRTQGPIKTRGGFEFRHIYRMGFSLDSTQKGSSFSVIVGSLRQQMDTVESAGPSGIVIVSDNTFLGDSASLYVGPFELVSGRDFVVGATAGDTATNIDTAINSLPGYSTILAAPSITVFGPKGQVGLRFNARYRGGNANFTFSYSSKNEVLGWSTLSDSAIKPPTILPTTPNYIPQP
jgi:hypothetical protein